MWLQQWCCSKLGLPWHPRAEGRRDSQLNEGQASEWRASLSQQDTTDPYYARSPASDIQPMDRSQPLRTQATHSDLVSEWELNLWPWHRWKRTWIFNYSSMLLSNNQTKVRYINLAINASMSVVSCWMKFTSWSGSLGGVVLNIYCANFIFRFHAFH